MQNNVSMKNIFSTILMSIKTIDQSINNKDKNVKTNFLNRQIALLSFFFNNFDRFKIIFCINFKIQFIKIKRNQYRQSSNDCQQQQKIVSVKIVIKNYRSRSARVNLSSNFHERMSHVACRI